MNSIDEWFEPIYIKNYTKMVKLAYYILQDKNLAEDVVQNAFFALLIKHRQLWDHPNIPGWLTKTVKNMADNTRNKASYMLESSLLPEHEPAVDGFPQDFMSLLPSGLSEKERQILYLHIEVGLPHTEIAAKLGCKPEACRMRLSRARSRCRNLLLAQK